MTVLESRRNRTETARLLGLIRPEDVPQAEWDQFVAERSTGEWKVSRFVLCLCVKVAWKSQIYST